MGKSQRLRDDEIRVVMRLLSDIREMRHDQPTMHRHLVDTLVRLVGGTCGYSGDVGGWQPESVDDASSFDIQFQTLTIGSSAADVVAQVMRGLAAGQSIWDDPTFEPGVKRQQTVDSFSFQSLVADQPDWRDGYPLFAQVTSDAKWVDHLVGLYHKDEQPDGKPGGNIFGVSLARYGDERLFKDREKALVKFVFEELHWLHRTGRLQPPVAGYEKLSPRLREIVTLLLSGLAPKQIARQLGLSIHTVRDHIKRVYEQLNVSGREELTAKFVRMNQVPNQPAADTV